MSEALEKNKNWHLNKLRSGQVTDTSSLMRWNFANHPVYTAALGSLHCLMRYLRLGVK